MIPFKQKPNGVFKNTAVLLILLCLCNVSLSYIQDFRTEDRTLPEIRTSRLAKDNSPHSSNGFMRETGEVHSYVRDVRADSRQSRIDARDIRTDFREIRSELRDSSNNRRFLDSSDMYRRTDVLENDQECQYARDSSRVYSQNSCLSRDQRDVVRAHRNLIDNERAVSRQNNRQNYFRNQQYSRGQYERQLFFDDRQYGKRRNFQEKDAPKLGGYLSRQSPDSRNRRNREISNNIYPFQEREARERIKERVSSRRYVLENVQRRHTQERQSDFFRGSRQHSGDRRPSEDRQAVRQSEIIQYAKQLNENGSPRAPRNNIPERQNLRQADLDQNSLEQINSRQVDRNSREDSRKMRNKTFRLQNIRQDDSRESFRQQDDRKRIDPRAIRNTIVVRREVRQPKQTRLVEQREKIYPYQVTQNYIRERQNIYQTDSTRTYKNQKDLKQRNSDRLDGNSQKDFFKSQDRLFRRLNLRQSFYRQDDKRQVDSGKMRFVHRNIGQPDYMRNVGQFNHRSKELSQKQREPRKNEGQRFTRRETRQTKFKDYRLYNQPQKVLHDQIRQSQEINRELKMPVRHLLSNITNQRREIVQEHILQDVRQALDIPQEHRGGFQHIKDDQNILNNRHEVFSDATRDSRVRLQKTRENIYERNREQESDAGSRDPRRRIFERNMPQERRGNDASRSGVIRENGRVNHDDFKDSLRSRERNLDEKLSRGQDIHLRRSNIQSNIRVQTLEGVKNVEFIPNFKENSGILINTIQAVLILGLIGQIFINTSKINNLRFTNWFKFPKEKLQ